MYDVLYTSGCPKWHKCNLTKKPEPILCHDIRRIKIENMPSLLFILGNCRTVLIYIHVFVKCQGVVY